MTEVGAGLVIFLFIAIGVAGFAMWIISLIEVITIPDHVYRIAGKEKVTWVLVVLLVSWIGALIWWFGPRREVKAVAATNPALPPAYGTGPPPGWYPDPSGGAGQAWWDGTRWTGHRQ